MIIIVVTLLAMWLAGVLVAAVDTREHWHKKNIPQRLPVVTILGRTVPPTGVAVAVCVAWPLVPLAEMWLRRKGAGRGSR